MENSIVGDGGLPRGSKIVTILELNQVMHLENFQVTEATEAIRRKDAQNDAAAQHFDKDFVDGSAVAQLKAGDTRPARGMTFLVDDHAYIITSVGLPFVQNQAHMVPIDITRMINPCITEPARPVSLTQNVAMSDITVATQSFFNDSNDWISNKAFSATGLPTGVSIDGVTGVISGTPTEVETVFATIQVDADETDELGNVKKRQGFRYRVKFEVAAA